MKSLRSPLRSALLISCALPCLFAPRFVHAQAGANLVANGDFSSFTTEDNLWDGVDGAGFLAGWRRNTYAETEAGKPGGLDMPVSVNFVDVNGDGLPDIINRGSGWSRSRLYQYWHEDRAQIRSRGNHPHFSPADREGYGMGSRPLDTSPWRSQAFDGGLE